MIEFRGRCWRLRRYRGQNVLEENNPLGVEFKGRCWRLSNITASTALCLPCEKNREASANCYWKQQDEHGLEAMLARRNCTACVMDRSSHLWIWWEVEASGTEKEFFLGISEGRRTGEVVEAGHKRPFMEMEPRQAGSPDPSYLGPNRLEWRNSKELLDRVSLKCRNSGSVWS